MPNGHEWSVEETRRIKGFFARLEGDLEAFAAARNLSIDCCYHDSPSWGFLFRHPLGGIGKIDLACVDDQAGVVHLHWWRDSYEEGVRYLRSESWPPQAVSGEDVSRILSDALVSILKWDGSLMKAYAGYKENWRRSWSIEAFEEQVDRYPFPTIA